MARLIYLYRNAPTLKNARALCEYDALHPEIRMYMLDSAAVADVLAAIKQAKGS